MFWEYISKKTKVSRPQKEGTDIHAVHRPEKGSATKKVDSRHKENPSGAESRAGGPRPPVRHIKCPVCNVQMDVKFMGRVEIDQCPKCEGVFLDRGELEAVSGHSLSTYQPDREEEHEVLIYTPKGLSDHL